MRSVHQALESLGATVAGLNRVVRRTVVAPTALARELGDRHEFDRGDTEFLQVVELLNDTVECAFRRERSGIQFVEDVLLKREPMPTDVRPVERVGINDLRWPMQTLRQQARHRIRNRKTACVLRRLRNQKVSVTDLRWRSALEKTIAVGIELEFT